MKPIIEEMTERLKNEVANGNITVSDMAELLAVVLPMMGKEKCENPAD